MTFPDFMLVVMFAVGIPVVLYSWKRPLYLVPLFVLLCGGLFGQVNLEEEMSVKIASGFTLVIRDFVVALMLIHVARALPKKKPRAVYRRPLVAFLIALLLNMIIKLMFFGSEFDPKVTPIVRFLVSMAAVYLLITCYLSDENASSFFHSCSLLAIVSVIVLIGYVVGAFPLPPSINPSQQLFVGGEATAIRLGLPNAYFLLFPYFAAIAPLANRISKLNKWDIVTIVAMLLGAFLALYRMYLSIVIIGVIVALMSRGGNLFKRLAIGLALVAVVFAAIQILAEANKSGIAGAVFERFGGVEEELQSEGSSGGSRIVRNFAALGALGDPSTAFLGTVFTFQDQEMRKLFVGDIGILSTTVYFGVAGFLLVFVIFKRGISLGLRSLRDVRLSGRVSTMVMLFLVAMIPATLFMYDPLAHETVTVLWMAMLGTYDALGVTRTQGVSSTVHAGP